MKITYFGHSAFQIETGSASILVDPFLTGNIHAEGKISPDDLSPSHILLTHAHGDHWGDTPAIAKRTGSTLIANFEITQYASSRHGIENIQPMNLGGWWSFEWGRVQQTLAWHSSSFPDGTYGGAPNGYIIHAEDKCLYNLGDTALFSEMQWIGDAHTIDVAFIPVGDCFTMGPADSIRAARMLKPKLVVPVHYNTFPYIEIDIDQWARNMDEAGFRTRVMHCGETLEL
jgi:L-ascorbate metabolism protein UlaG (beta-lactamase superfamily)